MVIINFDVLIENCTIITMDADRRILRNASIGINGSYIAYAGEGNADFQAAKIINGSNKVVMPGLIDSHAHAGHGLLKNIAEGILDEKLLDLYKYIYYQCTTQQFWFSEAMLSGLEKLKFGVTTGVSFLGSDTRFDEEIYAEAHVEGMLGVGIRNILCVGPAYPPYPQKFVKWDDMKKQSSMTKNLDDALSYTEKCVKRFNKTNSGMTYCYPSPSFLGYNSKLTLDELKNMYKTIKKISDEFGTPIHSHSFAGDIKFAHENYDILGENVFLAHVTGISDEEIKILADCGATVCNGPYTVAQIMSRCPVVELIDKGVNVTFCTDASAPDRTYDLFEKARMGIHLQRCHFHDSSLISAGKALEMITINAAKAIGLDKIIGSVEVGKKADLICIDMEKPHLYPVWQEPIRMIYQVSGQDVDTVIVNGKILLENYELTELNQKKILISAQNEAQKMLLRGGIKECIELPKGFWDQNHYNILEDDVVIDI